MATARSEAGATVGYETLLGGRRGDYVVPSYSEDGLKVSNGMVIGGSQARNEMSEKIARLFEAKGERIPIPESKPKGSGKRQAREKTAKAGKVRMQAIQVHSDAGDDSEAPQAFQPASVQSQPSRIRQSVTFITGLGKIKVGVDSVLESANGVCLVFRTDEDVSYTPEQGQELAIVLPDSKEVAVMSLGLQFSWPGTSQKLMVFIKNEATND